jgi:hypothetical protein
MMELDAIDRLAAATLDGYLVRKDLVRTFSRQFPVPTYVVEFLLGRYCASTDPEEIGEGIEIVQRQLADRTVKAGEEELFKSRAREKGDVKIIDLLSARLDAKTDSYLATLPSLRLNDARISPDMVRQHERMLTGGFYAEINLAYDGAIAQEKNGRPFGIEGLREIQLSKRDVLDDLAAARAQFSTADWKTLLLRSIGIESAGLGDRAKDAFLLRMVPFVERNYNLVELGPRGTGKSHLFQQISPYAHLISGGKATVARMFVNNATGQRGLVCQYDVVCFDEVSGISFDQKGRRQHHEGLHGIRRIQPGQREHPGRRLDRAGRQLRSRRRAPAADRPPARSHAARDARRHGFHGPHPRVPARLGRAQGQQRTVDRPFRPGQRLSVRMLEPTAQPESRGLVAGSRAFRRRAQRSRYERRQQDGQRPAQAVVPQQCGGRAGCGPGMGGSPGAGIPAARQRATEADRRGRVSQHAFQLRHGQRWRRTVRVHAGVAKRRRHRQRSVGTGPGLDDFARAARTNTPVCTASRSTKAPDQASGS